MELFGNMNFEYRKVISLIAEIKEQANSFIVSRMKNLGIEGLVTSHGNIMGLLYVKGPCRMADIAQKINRKKNTVTTLINKLLDHGYVEITPDINDNRVKMVSLTSKAMEIKDDFFIIAEELIETTFAGIEEEQRYEIWKYLKKIKENLS